MLAEFNEILAPTAIQVAHARARNAVAKAKTSSRKGVRAPRGP